MQSATMPFHWLGESSLEGDSAPVWARRRPPTPHPPMKGGTDHSLRADASTGLRIAIPPWPVYLRGGTGIRAAACQPRLSSR